MRRRRPRKRTRATTRTTTGTGTRATTGSAGRGGPGRRRRRRRGRRGGRGRRKELEATFDHGETDGYGLWLDPAVKDNPVYAEHWAGKREVTVRIDADQIVIRRAGAPDDLIQTNSCSSDQAEQGRRERGVLCTRATEDAAMRRSDGQLAAAGEVGGAPQVEPEGRVGERLRVALDRRGDVDRHLQAPVGALPVELGQLGRGEGRADPAAQLVADRVDDAVGEPALRGSSIACSEPRALLPLEERVLERIGSPRDEVTQAVGESRDLAQRGVGRRRSRRVELAVDPPDRDRAAARERARPRGRRAASAPRARGPGRRGR